MVKDIWKRERESGVVWAEVGAPIDRGDCAGCRDWKKGDRGLSVDPPESD